MILAFSVFIISLAGIVGLFALKEWEGRTGKLLAPTLRERLDVWAFRSNELWIALQADLEKLPPEIVHGARIVLHELALATAALLRFLSVQAHRLAELVSHKRNFVRRAPRSEFLKKVIEHKNGGGERGE